MKSSRLWKNRTAIKWYAALAIAFITIFQGYWLYTVYQDKKEILLRESENILRKTVLEYETKAIQEQIVQATDGLEMDEVTRNLLSALKNNKNLSIRISVDGQQFQDSLARDVMEKLTKEKAPSASDRSRKIYAAIKEELLATIGDIRFAVYHYNKEAADYFPLKGQRYDALTEPIRSEMDSKQYYELRFANLNSIVIREMIPSGLLSLIYIITCSTAVILLIVNVDKSRKLMQQKDNFTNNMTHEFKTPMATIYAAIEALDTYNVLDDKQMTREYLAMMKNDLNRLIAMTDSILFNAKMSDGELSLNFERTNLASFIQAIIHNLKPVLEKKQASVTLAPGDDMLWVMADHEHFGNVFRNLIDNAIKYSREDAAIAIRLSKEGNFARILVSDQGIGIPQKYRSEIFKPYFRIQENDVYTVKGYGLGLSYVRQIVELHSGKISLFGKDNQKGTTFEILIPIHHD